MTKRSENKPDEIMARLKDSHFSVPMLSAQVFARPLLAWYEGARRELPWRKKWPALAPAYDVFLSELMLQQTVVATVIPYFQRFKSLWPEITDLANCSEEALLREWAGLGYYARARNLRKAAIAIVEEHNGIFPQDEKALLALPGIGPYTAAALQAFAFDKPAVVLDGNVERVMARFAGLTTPLPELKKQLKEIYPQLAPDTQHSDFAQAIMDLGARICISGVPRCQACPLAQDCAMAHHEAASLLPVKVKKQPKPKRSGAIFVATYQGQAVMVRRPAKGLLGGMMGFPTIGWGSTQEAQIQIERPLDQAPFAADWVALNQSVRHVFTHFELTLTIYHAALDTDVPPDYLLVSPQEEGLASVFAKVWQVVADI